MDKITGISVFVQVADSGSYVAAGRVLGQTASSVGKTIVRLEEKLGVRLFHRNTRSISLTSEGSRFLERCRAIMRDINAAEEDIALYRDQLPNWRGHQGEHVLIHGGKVHGFFSTRSAARREGFQKFGYVAFLVKQVDLDEKRRPLVQVIL